MGTRADFYVGRGEKAEWIGSVAWDGYVQAIPEDILLTSSEEEFRQQVTQFLTGRDDKTTPDMGWPWPWEDSNTTDYTYAFDPQEGRVFATHFGRGWKLGEQVVKDAADKTSNYYEDGGYYENGDYWCEERRIVFPNMEHIQNVSLGKNSGIMIFTSEKE